MSWVLALSLDHPRAVLVGVVLATAFFAAGLPRLELRTDGEMLRPEGSAEMAWDERVSDRFREPRWVWMLVESAGTATAESFATPEGLRRLERIHQTLRTLDVLQAEAIRSLAALPRLQGGGGGEGEGEGLHYLRYEQLLDQVPDDDAAFQQLMEEIDRQPLARGLLLSSDGRRALFALPLAEGVPVRAAVSEIERLRERIAGPGESVLLGGPLLAETTLGDAVLRDLSLLVPVMVVVMAGLLALTLRCVGGVLIPMLEVLLVLVWTFGAMAWLSVPIALVTTILPVVLMAMSITDEVHLLERIVGSSEGVPRRARIETALGAVGRPIVLTSLTTAAGFLSFAGASIGPLRDFGFFASGGILLAMALTFTAIPAVALLVPESWLRGRSASAATGTRPRFAALAAERPVRPFIAGVLAFGILVPGIAWLRASDSWVANFAPDAPLVRMDQALNESFWGSYRLDVVLEGARGAFRSAEAMRYVAALRDEVAALPRVGGVETPLETLRPVAERFAEDRGPERMTSAELADLFTVAEMTVAAQGLRTVMAEDAALVRLRVYVPSADYEVARELRAAVEAIALRMPPPQNIELSYAGDLVVATAMVESIVENQLRSIAWAVAAVALLLLLFGGAGLAIPAVVPVVVATAALLGAMGLSGMELGIATSMFASLSVGVGVDFGIHFVHRYRALCGTSATREDAILTTFEQAGRALRWNALVLAAGFGVLMFSALRPNHALGLLLAAATLGCWAATVLLVPWILSRVASAGAGSGLGRSAATLAVLSALVLCTLALARPGRADALPCPRPAEPGATAFMQAFENAARSRHVLSRMWARTVYKARSGGGAALRPSERILWSVGDGDREATRMLFVFTAPGRMAGTSLLLRDLRGSGDRDETWLYLRAFDNFHRLQGAVERAIVPGTALSYEDARGFIGSDRYHFSALPRASAEAPLQVEHRRILGCPRTRELAERLGYGAIEVELDTARQLVHRLRYRGLGGGLQKEYELVEVVDTPVGSLPARVRLVHHLQGFENDLRYEHWPLPAPPEDALYQASVEGGSFLERLRALAHERGVGDRVDAEIAEAEERVRAYRERFGEGTRDR